MKTKIQYNQKQNKRIRFSGNDDEREYFLENLTMLIQSGITITQALESIRQETKNKSMKRMLENVISDVNDGDPLWRALERSDLLSSSAISLMRLGEESGRLTENLKVVNLRQRKDRAFKAKIRSAMMYPVIVIVLAIVMGLGIAWFILPKLAKVFSSMKIKLPLMTRVLIGAGEFIEKYGLVAIPLFIIFLIFILYVLFVNKKTKQIGEQFLFSIPSIKKIIQSIELARFGYIMGTLLQAGMSITQTIEALATSGTFVKYNRFYLHLQNKINQGETFKNSFESYGNLNKLIPLPQQHMIVAAEKSGNLTETFTRIGEVYEEKTENATKDIAIIIEPLLLVIVWIAVVFIALAVIMPIYSLIGGLQADPSAQTTTQSSASSQVENVPQTQTNEQVENGSNENNEAKENLEEVKTEKEQVISEDDEKIQEFQQQLQQPQEIVEKSSALFVAKILETEIGYLNVRKLPAVNSQIVGKLQAEKVVEVIEEKENWYRIILEDEAEGWINAKYAQKIEE